MQNVVVVSVVVQNVAVLSVVMQNGVLLCRFPECRVA
jgi:hypothetical protein